MTAGVSISTASGAVVPERICRVCGVTDVEVLELGEPSTWLWRLPDLCSRCPEDGPAGRSTPWEELARLCAENPSGVDVAPLLCDDGGRSGRMHPYLLRADVYALLGWIGKLAREPVILARTVPGGTQLTAAGQLDGAAVELVALTHREVPGAPGFVDLDVLIDVARVELEQLGRGLPC